MLRESPTSFNVDAAALTDEPPAYWRAWAEGAALAENGVVFFAYVAEEPVAMIAANLEGKTVHIGALWVSPSQRGHHFANALLCSVESWAHDIRATQIELSVAEWNDAAIRLYTQRHYQDTTERIATRFGHEERVMAKTVGF
jgi:ribosomal protein S18 acetylase RimI-like enzyme